jgi:hypothetical protein
MNRRLALLALAAPLIAAAPKPKLGPVEVVQAIYAAMPQPTPPVFLSRKLRGAFAKDAARRERNLDFEWRSGGQDSPAITAFHPRLIRAKGDAAVVEASFYNRGERRFRRFFLVREAGRWVVDDVLLVPENGKLADFLRGKG